MATLQQTLRGLPEADTQLTRGPGGVLQQKKTLQQATQQAGLSAAPTTPMMAQGLGASPDAAKMAGTPQQMNAALKQAAEPVQLQTALRRQQPRTQVSAQEQGRLQKSAEMQGLGGLGDRVTNFIDTEMQKLATAPVEVKAATTFEGKDVSGLNLAPDLEILRKNPNDTEAMVRVQGALGMDASKQLTADQINSLYESTSQSVGTAAASQIQNELTISDLISDPKFGYDMASLSGLLGVPEADLANYSVNQLSDKINEIASTEFGQTAQMQQQASSPFAGVAEREMARQAGQELSTTGIAAAEAGVQRLADTLERADTVSFAGTNLPVSELLKDETISSVIKDYLESPEGSDIRKELDSTEPALSKFITEHAATLSKAAAALGESATSFSQIQKDNKKLQTEPFGGIELNSDLMKQIIPDWGKLFSNKIDPSTIPLFSYAKSLSPKEAKIIANELNTAYENDPAIAQEISQLSAEQLSTLGIGKKNSNWEQMKTYNDHIGYVQDLPEEDTDSLIREVYSDAGSVAGAQMNITYGNILSGLGMESGVSLTSLDPSILKQQALSGKPKVSITGAASGPVPKYQKAKLGAPKLPQQGTPDYDIVMKLAPVLSDGDLTAAEISDPQSPISSFSLEELIRMEDLSASNTARIDKAAISQKRQEASTAATNQAIKERTSDNMMDTLDTYINMLTENPDPRKTDLNIVKSAIVDMAIREINTGRDWYLTMDKVYPKLLSLGLITPEFKQQFNTRNTERKKMNLWTQRNSKSPIFKYTNEI